MVWLERKWKKKKSHVIRFCLQASFHLHHSSVSHFRISALLFIRKWTQSIWLRQIAGSPWRSSGVYRTLLYFSFACTNQPGSHTRMKSISTSGLVFPAHLVLVNALFPPTLCQCPCSYSCLSHPIVDVRTYLVTGLGGSFKRIRALQSPSSKQGTQKSPGKLTTSPLYWICIYYLPYLSFFTVILIPCIRSGLCLYLSV